MSCLRNRSRSKSSISGFRFESYPDRARLSWSRIVRDVLGIVEVAVSDYLLLSKGWTQWKEFHGPVRLLWRRRVIAALGYEIANYLPPSLKVRIHCVNQRSPMSRFLPISLFGWEFENGQNDLDTGRFDRRTLTFLAFLV